MRNPHDSLPSMAKGFKGWEKNKQTKLKHVIHIKRKKEKERETKKLKDTEKIVL